MERLVELVRGRPIVVLTGAGCSTESGIPDYRGPGTRARARNPIQYRDFIRSEAGRQRYWARAVVGWPRFCAARPNDAHRALASLERGGAVAGLITQNVDRLHREAGSERVVELHGALAEVICLGCRAIEDRGSLQQRLVELNPRFVDRDAALAPDGDAELDDRAVAEFRVAPCRLCGGVLKPNVVFFGEAVPRDVVDAAFALLDRAELLLVVGSSLAVFSGLRFVRRAAERGLPIAIVNLGETRGDPYATLRVHARAGEALPALARALLGERVDREPPIRV